MKQKLYQCPEHNIDNYIENLLKLKHDTELNTILKNAKTDRTPPIQIARSDARHLEVIARLVKPKKILEFGTLNGYSAVALSRALVKDGILYTCEKSHHHATTATRNFEELKLNNKIVLIPGDALNNLKNLEKLGPYNIIFLDSKKEDYPKLFEWCVKNLIKGGLLLADNVFALGYINASEETISENLKKIVTEIKKFNELCASDTRLNTTILPTGEGLLVATKL